MYSVLPRLIKWKSPTRVSHFSFPLGQKLQIFFEIKKITKITNFKDVFLYLYFYIKNK